MRWPWQRTTATVIEAPEGVAVTTRLGDVQDTVPCRVTWRGGREWRATPERLLRPGEELLDMRVAMMPARTTVEIEAQWEATGDA